MNLPLHPILAAGLPLGADASKQNQARKDLDKFQGDWVPVSYTVDGKAATPDEFKTIKLTVRGAMSTFQRDGKVCHGRYTLDPSGRPHEIDILHEDGPHKGEVALGLYEVGDGKLTICLADPGVKERPGELASEAGGGHTLEVWRRAR
jgi:uncharacterized protein (TIGR03067 family)